MFDLMNLNNNHLPNPTNPSPNETPPQLRTMRINEGDVPSSLRQNKQAFLNVVRSPADLGNHVLIQGRTILGRDPNCSFSLQDLGVSWQHATITPIGNDDYVLEDLRSTNGTRVDGSPVQEQRVLRDGEKIFLGETVIRFSLADEMDVDFHSEVESLVGTDPLTGLPSKRRFDQALEFELQAAIKGNGALAMLMMDMDGVKQINDTYGHLFGAHVIGEAGRIIARVIDGKGRACRFGGDEFSAFLPGVDLDAAMKIAEQIRQTVDTAGMVKDEIPLHPTISIGVACYPEAGNDSTSLVAIADEALYRAKDLGKNTVSV
jgi:diguanylate cyclase (GGDEF)-like protein